MTRHPPQALTKNMSKSESIKVMKTTDKEIGQVAFKSEIDYSKKPIPKLIAELKVSLVG